MELYHFTDEQWNNLKAILTDNKDGFTDDQWKMVVRIPTRNLYAVTQHLLTRRNFIFLNSPRGFWRSLEERSHNFNPNHLKT